MQTKAMPSSVRKWAAKNAVAIYDIHIELDELGGTASPYSIVCNLKDGWICKDTGRTTIHESHYRMFLDRARSIEKWEEGAQ